jgi:hypothetical protein
MSKYLWSACTALVFLGSGLGGTVSLAKPPDLPVDMRVDFGNEEPPNSITLGVDLFSGKLSLNISLPWALGHAGKSAPAGEPGSTISDSNDVKQATWVPDLGITLPSPNYIKHQPEQIPSQSAPTGDSPDAQKRMQARTMFKIAERCLHNGDLDMARTCYEETHLLAPETRLGRKAIQRLADIDRVRTEVGLTK